MSNSCYIWALSVFLSGLGIALTKECLNGGTATANGKCDCQYGYTGVTCEQKVSRFDGTATYNLEISGEETNVSDIVNESGFKKYINEIMFVNAIPQWTEVTSLVSRGNVVTFSYSIFVPPIEYPTINSIYGNQVVTASLGTPEAVQMAFGKSQNATLSQSDIDLDECHSKLDNCHINATCIDTEGSFKCICKEGFQGNGTYCQGIFCIYGKAPPSPARSQTEVRSSDKLLSDVKPEDALPYGTTIIYNCSLYYDLQNSVTKEPFAQAIVCLGTMYIDSYKNSGWSGTTVTCGISNGFKIAIMTSVISSILIITIGSCLLMNKCVEMEKKSKNRRRKHLQEEEFDEVDGRTQAHHTSLN